VEGFLEIAPVFWGGPLIITTILAPSVVLGALAAWMALSALAALAANLFLFRFSAGVALGGSRASPGITFGVPVANLPICPFVPKVQMRLGSVMSRWKMMPVFPPNLWRLV
jgi:hypothetical protein